MLNWFSLSIREKLSLIKQNRYVINKKIQQLYNESDVSIVKGNLELKIEHEKTTNKSENKIIKIFRKSIILKIS